MDISFLIATNRNFEVLQPTLEAFKQQRLGESQRCQLILVDNSPEGRLKESIEPMKNNFPFPLDCIHEPKRGRPAALNAGVRAARYPVVSILDDDMIPERNYLEAMTREFEQHPDLSVLVGRVRLPAGYRWPLAINDKPGRAEYSFPCNPWNVGSGNSMNIHKKVFDQTGLFDENFGGGKVASGEDIEFIYRILKNGFRIFYSPEIVSFHFHGRDTERGFLQSFEYYGEGAGFFFSKNILAGDFYVVKLFFWTLQWAVMTLLRPQSKSWIPDSVLQKKAFYFTRGIFRGLIQYPFRKVFQLFFERPPSLRLRKEWNAYVQHYFTDF